MLDQTTRSVDAVEDGDLADRIPALRILFHPDARRIGERAWLEPLMRPGGVTVVSRLAPLFPSSEGEAPLADPFLSRKPLHLRREASSIAIEAEGVHAVVEGRRLTSATTVPLETLDEGVVVELGQRVVLLLCAASPGTASSSADDHGLIGDSDAIAAVRRAIDRVAGVDVSVMLYGESGTGKEVVARAIHQKSKRRDRAWVAVNMAALPAQTSASLLFGHARGSFTGAVQDHRGFFHQADGGTLFLDEIGDTPAEAQAMLLRALETKEVQPLGATRSERVDVRVIAATDVDLDEAITRGSFRRALFHRLSGYEIALPPLRVRRPDITPLFFHFLRSELRALDAPIPFDAAPEKETWIDPAIVASLLRHHWPGNVRELANVARVIAISSRGEKRAVLDRSLDRCLVPAEPPAFEGGPRGEEPTEAQIRAALENNDWSFAQAARELGISRSRLYARARHVPTARALSKEAILAALAQHNHELAPAARALEISHRALILRMAELDIERGH